MCCEEWEHANKAGSEIIKIWILVKVKYQLNYVGLSKGVYRK